MSKIPKERDREKKLDSLLKKYEDKVPTWDQPECKECSNVDLSKDKPRD